MIHRQNSQGMPICGAKEGLVSRTGIKAMITCPHCLKLMTEPTRQEKLEAFEKMLMEIGIKKD